MAPNSAPQRRTGRIWNRDNWWVSPHRLPRKVTKSECWDCIRIPDRQGHLMDQHWANLCHPFGPTFESVVGTTSIWPMDTMWLTVGYSWLNLAQRSPTIGQNMESVVGSIVMLSGWLPTCDPQMGKGWANAGPSFTFVTCEPKLRALDKMTLDQPWLLPTLDHQAFVLGYTHKEIVGFLRLIVIAISYEAK